MESNELRIGNYVYDDDNDIMQISEIFREGCSFIGSNVKNLHSSIKPIPLTEEWLVKFGLKERYCKDEWSWAECKDDGEWQSYTEITKENDEFIFLGDYQKIKYVHQLQNLYFILTGEELKFIKHDTTL